MTRFDKIIIAILTSAFLFVCIYALYEAYEAYRAYRAYRAYEEIKKLPLNPIENYRMEDLKKDVKYMIYPDVKY